VCPGVAGQENLGHFCEVKVRHFLGYIVELSNGTYGNACFRSCLRPIVDPPDPNEVDRPEPVKVPEREMA
jgi:hypothetical protein